MAVANLRNDVGTYGADKDDIVIVKHGDDIPGGKTIDTTDYKGEVIRAGQVVVTDGKGAYKALGITAGKYDALPAGFKPCGVVVRSVPKDKPFVSVLLSGVVNEGASPAPVTDEIKTALPRISFLYGPEVTE